VSFQRVERGDWSYLGRTPKKLKGIERKRANEFHLKHYSTYPGLRDPSHSKRKKKVKRTINWLKRKDAKARSLKSKRRKERFV